MKLSFIVKVAQWKKHYVLTGIKNNVSYILPTFCSVRQNEIAGSWVSYAMYT